MDRLIVVIKGNRYAFKYNGLLDPVKFADAMVERLLDKFGLSKENVESVEYEESNELKMSVI